jgi:hypothetical protein
MFGDSVCMFTVVTTTHVPNTELYPVYCLSGLCLFSVATATSLLKKTSRQTHAVPLALVVSICFHGRSSIWFCVFFNAWLIDRYGPILLGDNAVVPDGATYAVVLHLHSRTCRLCDHPSTWVNVRIISSLASVCDLLPPLFPIHSWELDTTRFCASTFTQLSSRARSRIFLVRSSSATKHANDRLVHYIPCVVASNCVYLASSRRRLPMETFEHCCLNLAS